MSPAHKRNNCGKCGLCAAVCPARPQLGFDLSKPFSLAKLGLLWRTPNV
ncbi:MAG: hypothetical protein KBT78_10755 [Marinobacter psychrophilus]|nr:hypothetical protein [Marinobacter psychrophilus]MBQ0845288.1 hypothetical protein [Marinobacter psychrophilus]